MFTTTTATVMSKLSYKCIDKERDALLHFKSYLDHHEPDGALSTWTTEEEEATNDCCNWSGVECNNQSHVTGLYLQGIKYLGGGIGNVLNRPPIFHVEGGGDNLEGKISPSLLNLSYLIDLDLSFNSFHGSIPKFIGSMTQLKSLDLGANYFTGIVPPELGNLTNLKYLSLYNLISCTVENLDWLSHLSNLEILYMDGISLAKANKWVNMILSLQNLSYLSLDGCDLSHVMHPYSYSSFNSSSSSILQLYLENNNLNTSMYHWLFPLTSNALQTLSLSANNLDWIPKYLGNLCSLTFLVFNDNLVPVKLSDLLNNLSGCTSRTLQLLQASSSRLTGSLSDDILKFSSLSFLDLSNNRLDWTISEKVWKLPKLSSLDISNNSLEGVPSEAQMPNISSIKDINWSSCKLGPRFPKWIQALKNLSSINLAHNKVSDTIPEEFWNMWPSQLIYLNLSSNNITGIITNLSSNFNDYLFPSTLDLSSNNFYGPIPDVPFNLITLDLSRNKFSGEISSLCQFFFRFITLINLSHNSFTGQIPDCLYHFTTLEFLNLGHNSFSGRVPASIQHLINLKVLNLYNNSLSGELPSSLQNCTDLKFLELGANNFSGYVPVWIGEKLSRLHALSLTSNKLFGTIPLQLCELVHLQILDLSMNSLNGTIPTCLSNLMSMNSINGTMSSYSLKPSDYKPKSPVILPMFYVDYVDQAIIKWQGHLHEFSKTLGLLTIIDLSRNNLTGKIPQELTNLNKLIALDLSMNALHGEIPLDIGEMKELQILDLSRNNLSGVIPSSMSEISPLDYLDLSYNNLSGKIPSGTQLQTFDPSRYIGNEGLCGLPLSKHCLGDKEKEATLAIGEGHVTEDDIQMWFYIGGAIGFSIGFWMVCIALLVNRRGRHTFFHFLDHLENWIYVKVMILIAKSQRVASP
ncbi:hypothetical protein QVD17_01021 [Tagetes erecta]|uniref:Leucine-rich repeat-containing N-terminal plant-type domain-containing protein n=1 Tax=Tagetes erecta TaxID=13708 RepID=A0AAD8L482_TARER|nr:hypothetical protein QVD17_01021 [Tagetes erecta]